MKKILLIIVPLLLIGGGVVGAAFMGMINIPGITPKKPVKKAMYGEQNEPPKAKPPAPSPVFTAPPRAQRASQESPQDLEKGAKRVARLWNELPTERLVAIAGPWRDDELARVIMHMDGEKAAALLARMEAARASRLSRAIQRLAAAPASN